MEQAEYNKLIETLKEQVAAEDVEAPSVYGQTLRPAPLRQQSPPHAAAG